MKKLINDINDIVREQLAGMAAAHPELKINVDPHYIVRSDAPIRGKVAIISGGGSGHEPMHGGFVGPGMLDGACPGEIFTSPTPDQMYECGKVVNSGFGVLFLVKNYTGDVLSFETAAELLHAEGIPVQNILIDDDVAVKDSLYTAGRRDHSHHRESCGGCRRSWVQSRSVRRFGSQGESIWSLDGDGAYFVHRAIGRQTDL